MSAAYEEAAFLQQLDPCAGQTNSVMLRAMTLRVRIKTVPDFQVVLGGVPQTRRARHGRFRQRIFAEPTVMYAEIRILTMIALPQNHDMIAQSIIDPSAGAPMSTKAVPARAPTHGGNATPIPNGDLIFITVRIVDPGGQMCRVNHPAVLWTRFASKSIFFSSTLGRRDMYSDLQHC